MGTLLLVANVDWYVISHRLKIIEHASSTGWKVIVACHDSGRSQEIRATGAEFIDFPFSRSGTNPFTELLLVVRFIRLYTKIKPDIVHHVSLKPVVYGSLAARLTRVPAVLNAISGLGYTFTNKRKSMVQKLMVRMMTYGFKRKNLAIVFQNRDDYSEMEGLGITYEENRVHFIKGSGVDLQEYGFKDLPSGDKVKVLLPSRMLWDKGVRELREASEILEEKYINTVTFILAGMADDENKAGVPKTYLKDWENGSYVKWLGHCKNMIEVYADSHIVVLPSYREGMPKSLIEASAIGRPIITTTAIGCKECVDEGMNGFKVPVKNSQKLAEAIAKLVDDEKLREKMSKASRDKAVREYDINLVIDKHMDIYNNLLSYQN